MLTITKTHTSVETDGNETNTFTTYETTGSVELAMDSMWDYDGADTVNVSSIQIIETVDNTDGYSYKQVNVEHDNIVISYPLRHERHASNNELQLTNDFSTDKQGHQRTTNIVPLQRKSSSVIFQLANYLFL